MRSNLVVLSLLFLAASASFLPKQHQQHRARSPQLFRRDNTEACTDLSVSANNGNRKVAIVIDSSGSMSSNDPDDLRILAGQALNSFLVSSSEAGGDRRADQIAVIDFDDEAYLNFPLGDPGQANASFADIDTSGGTYIASGVLLATQELTKTGDTDKRSAIVVFTDGEDSSTEELVYAITNATALGIRVSFGFLDTSAANQDEEIIKALRDSRGVYATITEAAGSQSFINYVLLNGLTYNDNPQGYDSQLLPGLSETHYVSGSETRTLKYSAELGENITFVVTDISAGGLSAVAQMNGQKLDSIDDILSSETLSVTAPGTGELQLLVTGQNAPSDSMFSVLTDGTIKNCTVAVSPTSSGLTAGAKAGIGVGVTAAVLGLLGTGGWFAYKHFIGGGGSGGGIGGGAGGGGAGGGVVPPGDGGLTQAPMAEKLVPHVDMTPLDPMSSGPPPGDPSGGGLSSVPGDGGLSAGPNTTGLEGTAHSGGGHMPVHGPGTGMEGGGLGDPTGGGVNNLAPQHTGFEGGAPPDPTVGGGGGYGPPPMGPPGGIFAPPIVPVVGVPLPRSHQGSPAPGPYGPYASPAPGSPAGPYGVPHAGSPGSPYGVPHAGSPLASPPAQQPMYEMPYQGPGSTTYEMPYHGPGNSTYEMPSYPGGDGGHGNTTGYGTPPPGVGGSPAPSGGGAGYGLPLPVGVGAVPVGGRRDRHHHHPWLGYGVRCEDGGCPYNLPGHACPPNGCECECRDPNCPLR